MDDRPVPHDALHAFFCQWLPASDPDVSRWEAWFRSHAVRYDRVERGQEIMLYTHRLYGAHSLWCCDLFPRGKT